MRILCSSALSAWKKGACEGWLWHQKRCAWVALRPRRASLNNESLLGRVHSVRHENFNAKSQGRKDATQPSRHPILTTKGTKSTKKNHPHGLFQNFVSSALFLVESFLRNERIWDIALQNGFLTMPVRGSERWMLLVEPIELPVSASWRLGVLALRPCRMVSAEGLIKVDQTESNQIKPARR
jgi:hypothetical protein